MNQTFSKSIQQISESSNTISFLTEILSLGSQKMGLIVLIMIVEEWKSGDDWCNW